MATITIAELRDLLGWLMLRQDDVLQVDYDGNMEVIRDGKWIGMIYVGNGFVRIFGDDRQSNHDYPKEKGAQHA